MTDVQYWYNQLSEEVETINQLLDQLHKLTAPMEKAQLLDEIENRMKSAQSTKRTLKHETIMIIDISTRKKYESKLKKLDQQMLAQVMDVKALRSGQERNELLAKGNDVAGFDRQDMIKAGDNKLVEASHLQNKTQISLNNTKNMIERTKEVGISTLEELYQQRTVLDKIDKETDPVNDNLTRSKALIKQFAKGIATDKFIQCFAAINCILLTCLVIFSLVKKGKLHLPGDKQTIEPVRNLSYFLRGEHRSILDD